MMESELVLWARRDEVELKEKLSELVKTIVDDSYDYTIHTIDDAIATLKTLKHLRKMHRFDDFVTPPPPILIMDPVILATGQSGLGQDLVSEILTRLPVKSLIRFKYVDRSWDALFRTPTFITRHMQLQHKHKGERLITFGRKEPRFMISDDPSQSPDIVKFGDPFMKPLYSIHPFTSSHKGVFCLYGLYDLSPCSGDFALWNPATREVKLVTPPPSYIPTFMDCDHSVAAVALVCGFGGDPNLSIVALVTDDCNPHHYPSAELYNLKTNSWTLLKDTIVPIKNEDLNLDFSVPRTDGTLANGVCHWLVCDWLVNTKIEHVCILCFDFRNNQFSILELPPQPTSDSAELLVASSSFIHKPFLDVINDSIAYVLPHLLPYWEAEIWILEQDNRWTKKYKFGPLDREVHIFTVWKDGAEFLGRSGLSDNLGNSTEEHLVLYNPNGQAVCHFDDIVFSWNHLHYVRKYVESITPLSLF